MVSPTPTLDLIELGLNLLNLSLTGLLYVYILRSFAFLKRTTPAGFADRMDRMEKTIEAMQNVTNEVREVIPHLDGAVKSISRVGRQVAVVDEHLSHIIRRLEKVEYSQK